MSKIREQNIVQGPPLSLSTKGISLKRNVGGNTPNAGNNLPAHLPSPEQPVFLSCLENNQEERGGLQYFGSNYIICNR